ncbi:hypothetical protein FACS1894102_5690 [Spirochaetia bacterium]|nr:hypothetical protein FACS1894102_5690 [Spirochaetia bacterium]
MFTDFATKDIITIAYTIAIVNFVSLFLALTILPSFFSLTLKQKSKSLTKLNVPIQDNLHNKTEFDMRAEKNKTNFKKVVNKIRRKITRSCTNCFCFTLKYPKIIILLAVVITSVGFVTVLVSGTDTNTNENEKTIYGQIEFRGGIRSEIVDKSLELWALKMKEVAGVSNVQCNSHVDSAAVLVSFNPQIISAPELRNVLKKSKIQGGFLYIPENTGKDRSWSITVSGDEAAKCKETARLIAEKCSVIPIVQETVLNFKDGSKSLTFMPQRDRIAALKSKNQNVFSAFANSLRWNIHGPVAYKRSVQTTLNGVFTVNEVDVRIRGLGINIPERKNIFESVISSGDSEDGNTNSNIMAGSVLTAKEGIEDSSIRRLGRRRIASVSVRTAVADARKIKSIIMRELKDIKVPKGYSVEFDRDAIEAAESLSKGGFYFLMALVFCYMIIAAVNESFFVPLIVLSVVPVSAALSAVYLQIAGFKFNAAAACALLSVCGIAVNSSVVIVDNILKTIKETQNYSMLTFYKAVRKRLIVLLATSGTTILAALPFIVLQENANSMIKVLSLVTASGVFASLMCSLFLVPSIIFKVNYRHYKL